MDNDIQNLRDLTTSIFDDSKKWWRSSFSAKFGLLAIGIIAITFNPKLPFIPIVSTILFLVSYGSAWYSRKLKGTAESLLGKLDFYDALGWEISKKEISDIWATVPIKLQTTEIIICSLKLL